MAAAAAATAGCAAGPDTACALVYYSPGLQVVLDGWPPAVDRAVEVECEGCDPAMIEGVGTLRAPLGVDGVAEIGLPLHAPEITVRVLEGDVVLSDMTAEPDYRSIDGDVECPGPSEALVVVPAP
ncbi:hypothetical protein TEK04_06365 [Klenkia sp. LSe6-5]|uniref:Lipoprotein n=1 Tax=Klenkia sesuvii TaxID=3103137 RepID=A0ABU8DR60_9ACTN